MVYCDAKTTVAPATASDRSYKASSVMLPDEMRRLKAHEEVDSLLKKVMADLTLDRQMLQAEPVWQTIPVAVEKVIDC